MWNATAAVAAGCVDMSGVLADTLPFRNSLPWVSESWASLRQSGPPASLTQTLGTSRVMGAGVEVLSPDSQLIAPRGLKNALTPIPKDNFSSSFIYFTYCSFHPFAAYKSMVLVCHTELYDRYHNLRTFSPVALHFPSPSPVLSNQPPIYLLSL